MPKRETAAKAAAAAAFAEKEISWKLRTDILRMFWAVGVFSMQNFAPNFVLCQWLCCSQLNTSTTKWFVILDFHPPLLH